MRRLDERTAAALVKDALALGADPATRRELSALASASSDGESAAPSAASAVAVLAQPPAKNAPADGRTGMGMTSRTSTSPCTRWPRACRRP